MKCELYSWNVIFFCGSNPLFVPLQNCTVVFFAVVLCQCENHVVWFSKREGKKNWYRSVKRNLALKLLCVDVRSTPLGNRTDVLVLCCVPQMDHQSSTLQHPVCWLWTMIITIIDWAKIGKCTFSVCNCISCTCTLIQYQRASDTTSLKGEWVSSFLNNFFQKNF